MPCVGDKITLQVSNCPASKSEIANNVVIGLAPDPIHTPKLCKWPPKKCGAALANPFSIRCSPSVDIYSAPAPSIVMKLSEYSESVVALHCRPKPPLKPFPATVVMLPVVFIFLILALSLIYTLPPLSVQILLTVFAILAAVAALPSPEKPVVPVPANVLMMPAGLIFLTRAPDTDT